jgi:hypothetical protein
LHHKKSTDLTTSFPSPWHNPCESENKYFCRLPCRERIHPATTEISAIS